jgi:hypothetical protein
MAIQEIIKIVKKYSQVIILSYELLILKERVKKGEEDDDLPDSDADEEA